MLSLGSWPTEPSEYKNIQLTPITKRIISQVHINIKEILPISFDKYRFHYLKVDKCSDGLQQNYRFELERRKKKISILTDIRQKYIIGKEYSSRSAYNNIEKIKSPRKTKKLKNSCIHINKKQQLQNIKHLSSRLKSQPKLTLSSFKNTSPKRENKLAQKSDYFMPFNPHKKDGKIHFNTGDEQQSTKSKYMELKDFNDSNTQREVHQQYGLFTFKQNGKQRQNHQRQKLKVKLNYKEEHSELQLCRQLLTTMQQLELLTRKHEEEMNQMQNLTVHERERLAKIHQIQKSELQTRLKRIKSRLQSHSFSQH